MHGTVPLLRPVTASVTHSTSRIPHLNFHIVQRKGSSLRAQRTTKINSSLTRREQSTSINAETWKTFTDVVEEKSNRPVSGKKLKVATSSKGIDFIASSTADFVENEEQSNLYTILNDGHPDQILYALLDETIGIPFLRYATDELFDKALLSLDPEHFVESYKRAYRYIWLPDNRTQAQSILRIEDRLENLALQLDKIISIRSESGSKLSLEACRHLLKWAGSLGNEAFATNIMNIVKANDDMRSDVACHNYYLQATNWNGAFTQAEKFLLRVIPRHLKLRALTRPPKSLSGHRVSNPKQDISGIRSDVLKIFKQLIEKDLTANEFTFVNLMIGMGREADMTGVKSVLKSVWNIDVDLLHTFDEDEVESPTFYETDSPLRPSERLLFAVVHVFGSNNDARTAWLLVDYISRNYDLRIPETVWQHLLEWYLLLSLPRSAAEVKQGRKIGFIPPEVLSQMFGVMIDEPFNVKPSGVMYYLLSRSEKDRHRLNEQLEAIRNLRTRLMEQRAVVDGLTRRLEPFFRRLRSKYSYNFWADRSFFQDSDAFIKASIEFEALKRLMRHAVKHHLFLKEYARPYHPTQEQWEHQLIPDLFAEFAEFLPSTVEYRISTGNVSIGCKEHRDQAQDTKYGRQDKLISDIRSALDVHDHENRFNRVHRLAHTIRCGMCDSSDHYTGECPHDGPQSKTLRNSVEMVKVHIEP